MSVDPDREQVRAAAAEGLRQALAAGQGVGDAVRGCFYRHPAFASALLEESLRLRFGQGCDVRLITAFVARIRASSGDPPGGFPSREAEALIRACLGELALLDAVDPSRVNYPELGIAVLGGLFEEWRPSPGEVDGLFRQTETVRQEAADNCAEVPQAVEDWFDAGMPDSPFAWPVGGTQSARGEEER